MLPDCPHNQGFRQPVRKDDGSVDGICRSCGDWVRIRDAEVGIDTGEGSADVFHTRTVAPNGDPITRTLGAKGK